MAYSILKTTNLLYYSLLFLLIGSAHLANGLYNRIALARFSFSGNMNYTKLFRFMIGYRDYCFYET